MQGDFSQPIFRIMPDESIEIVGLPLWSKKQMEIVDGTTKRSDGIQTVSVYSRIHDALPWIADILSNRCERSTPTPFDCNQQLVFSKKSCERVISSSGNDDAFLSALQTLFFP